MNQQLILTDKTVDIDKLDLKPVSKGNNNYLYTNATYKLSPAKSVPFKFCLSNLRLSTSASYLQDYDSYSCIVQLSNEQYEVINNMNTRLAELGLPLFKEAMGKKAVNLDPNNIQVNIKPENEELGYAPSLSCKFKFNPENNTFWCDLVDLSGTKLSFTTENPGEFLKRNSLVDIMFNCTVYKTGSNYGVSWKPSKIRVKEVGEDVAVADFPEDDEEFVQQASSKVVNDFPEESPVDEEDEDEELNMILNSKSRSKK
jgi:hypothetical protein